MKTVTVTHKQFETNPVTMLVSVWELQSSEIKANYTVVYN